jgi:Protein of unknown function (DUF998)
MLPERRTLAIASVTLSMVGVVAVGALHVLRPDLGPVSHRLSEYAIGRYGVVMTMAFACTGVGLLLLAGAILRADRTSSSRFVAAAVGFAGVGLVTSGLYHTDASRSGATADAVHSAASGLATLALIGSAASWTAVALRRAVPLTLAVMAVVLGGISPALHRSRWTGLSQRLLWFTLLAWTIVAAIHLAHPHVPSNRGHRTRSS